MDENKSISILNVGTRILRKDLMDQYIRTLGNFKTYYAANLNWALRSLREKQIDIVIAEVELEDGSAFRLRQTARFENSDIYTILAIDENDSAEAVWALAEEIDANAVIVKPFTQADIRGQLEAYEKWIAAKSDPWRKHLHAALDFIREKRLTEAEKQFTLAMSAAPRNPIPFCKAGIYYLGQSNYDLSKKLLEQAIAINPKFVQAISTLGLVYLGLGELQDAERLLKQAQAISPLNPDRLNKIAFVSLLRAVNLCRLALQSDPSHFEAHRKLGQLLVTLEEYTEAFSELERALPMLDEKRKIEVRAFMAVAKKLGGLPKDKA